MKEIAILDDFQNVALGYADWDQIRERAEITVFNDHLEDADAIAALDVAGREDYLVGMAHSLEDTAREAMIEGNQQYAMLSRTMAEAIFNSADELARDSTATAAEMAAKATIIISNFNTAYPYRIVSYALN